MRRRDALRAGGAALALGLAGPTLSRPAAGSRDDYAPLGRLDLPGATELVVGDDGTTAFVAVSDGYATVDLSDPAEPRVLAERRGLFPDREHGPLGQVYDVALDGDRLLVVGPAHGGPEKLRGALTVDVSDPADPVRESFHETAYPIHNCDLAGSYAYLTANGDPIRLELLDVTTGEVVGTWSLPGYDEAWSDVPPGLRTLHDVRVRDEVAYLAHWDAGTWLLDVSDPTNPRVVAHLADQSRQALANIADDEVQAELFTPPGNSHYAAPNEDGSLLAVGRESWALRTDDGDLVGGPSGIDLYDLADPTAPEHLATLAPEAVPDPTYRGTWTTAHNFAFRGDTFYAAWYHGGVKRYDCSDPAEPEEVTWWRDAEAARFWTAVPAADCFVASSMGVRGGAAPAVFTFPDEPGRGGRPLPEATPTPSATELGGGSVSPTPTPTPTETPTPSPTPTETSSPTPASSVGAPGFGALATLTGVGLCLDGLRRLAGSRRPE